jgi:hypothetical protein
LQLVKLSRAEWTKLLAFFYKGRNSWWVAKFKLLSPEKHFCLPIQFHLLNTQSWMGFWRAVRICTPCCVFVCYVALRYVNIIFPEQKPFWE